MILFAGGDFHFLLSRLHRIVRSTFAYVNQNILPVSNKSIQNRKNDIVSVMEYFAMTFTAILIVQIYYVYFGSYTSKSEEYFDIHPNKHPSSTLVLTAWNSQKTMQLQREKL